MFPDIASVLSTVGETDAKQQAEQQTRKQVQAAALADPANQAMLVKQTFAPAVLASITNKNLGPLANAAGFKVFCDQYVAECGSPTDPAELMLVQQLLWSHHRIGQLLVDAAAATSPQLADGYNTAAAKLMAEYRRSMLALRQYRAPILAKQVTVVKNVAAGNQQIAVMQGDRVSRPAGQKHADSKLGPNEAPSDNAGQPNPFASSDCKPTEQLKAKRPVSGRPAAVA